MSSAAVPFQAGSLVASEVASEGAVILKLCQVVPWPVPAASAAGSVEAVAASEEETEVASVAVSIAAAEASEAVTADSVGHQTRQADRAAADMVTVIVEITETVGAAVADTADATTTEDTAAEAATAEVIGPAPGATPCRSANGTEETGEETGTEVEIATETETETGIVAATTTVTTRGNDPTKEGQATKVNANCAATDDKTAARLVVGILSPLISLLSSSTSLASLTTRVSRRKQVFPHPGQLHTPCLKVKANRSSRNHRHWSLLEDLARTVREHTIGFVLHPTYLLEPTSSSIALPKSRWAPYIRARTGSISPCKMTCVSCTCQSRGRKRLE